MLLDANNFFQTDAGTIPHMDARHLYVSSCNPCSGDNGNPLAEEYPTAGARVDPSAGPSSRKSNSDRLWDNAKALLRRMEILKNKSSSKRNSQSKDGILISGPKLVNEAHMQERMAELSCVDISPEGILDLNSCSGTTESIISRDSRQSTIGEDSSSIASYYSPTSTPLFQGKGRTICREGADSGFGDGEGRGEKLDEGGRGGGLGSAYSDSECSLASSSWRQCAADTNDNTVVPPLKVTSSTRRKRSSSSKVTSSGRRPRATHLRNSVSLTYGRDSEIARERLMANMRRGIGKNYRSGRPMPNITADRRSMYDNIPLHFRNRSYQDFRLDFLDSEVSIHEGSVSSECTPESRDSPLPSVNDDDTEEEFNRRRPTVDKWHSFHRKAFYPSPRQMPTKISDLSAGQMLSVRKKAVMRLTALLECYCPSNRSKWNWELPKFMRKIRSSHCADHQVFGVPLHVIAKRSGQPIPTGIQAAFQYLRTHGIDQVGIFRKPGVRSRIQRLLELHEVGEDIDYHSFGTCDVADMVKTYFRELPEVLLTNKLSEMFIAIFQYIPKEYHVDAVQCAILMLPDENREVLMTFLTFLADVADASDLNQMTASNLAVCLAPLFHVSDCGSSSSPLRRKATGLPEQRDLHENKAAYQCLTLMIEQVSELQCVPPDIISSCRFTYLEQSQPVYLEDLGVVGSSAAEGDWVSYMDACISALLKEARDKLRGWIHINCADPKVELLYRKVGDGHPLRLWRVTTEVEAPPSELLSRIIRERHLWDDSLLKWSVVTRLNEQAEVFQYMCNSMAPSPPVDFCVLRCWRSGLPRGSCALVETSVKHSDAPVFDGGVRGVVLASRYLIQPCGAGKSRIVHISRIDMRGRTPTWYNKIFGHLTANLLTRIRQGFHHQTAGPESSV